jgi:hypothetical protein
MSGYSKAYQEVIAGRVREDEQIAFYGDNKVALPARVTNFVSMGGATQPVIAEFANEFVGKNVDMTDLHSTKHNYGAYLPPKVQIS